MDIKDATQSLSALAQETRLATFKRLVSAGVTGLSAGSIAGALKVPHNTLSSHLNILANAGLITSARQGRSVIYRVDFEGARTLLAYLMADCCAADPALTEKAVQSSLSRCC